MLANGYSADVRAFSDARHEVFVVGTAEEGYRLWCTRCDRMGDGSYRSRAEAARLLAIAQQHTAELDIVSVCRLTERG